MKKENNDETTDTKKEMTEAETSGQKYCSVRWTEQFGTNAVVFIETDKAGNPVSGNTTWKEPEPGMSEEFENQTRDSEMSSKEFGRAAEKFAKSRGFTVVGNDWLETKLDEATNAEKLKETIKQRLLGGVVHFKYQKVGTPAKINRRTGEITPAVPGETREAWGTLNQDLIRRSIGDVERAASRHRIPTESVVTYFDIHAVNRGTGVEGDWRCFKLANFQGFID